MGDRHAPEPAASPTPEAGPLLLERLVRRGLDEFARRVCADGSVWVRSHLPRPGADGWKSETGEPDWQLEATLPADALAALRAAILASGFFELPTGQDVDAAVIGASEEVWSAELDGRRHSVRGRGLPETRVAALSELAGAVEDALAAAEQQGLG